MSALKQYTSVRRYTLDNRRFNKHAEMVVRMDFTAPGQKRFEVISESGSAIIRNRIFRKMMDSEMEAARAANSDVTPRNYDFRLLGQEDVRGRKCYVLSTTPKEPNTYLFEGRIWVDAQDFAIVQINGRPAKNPSFWIRKTEFTHQYNKFGPFWLALSNVSHTDAMIFGRTDVTIEYYDYSINRKPASGAEAATAGSGSGT